MDTIPPSMHARTLYKGQIVSVIDVSCGSPAGPCGAEERAAGNHLVFVRRGVWTKHSGAGMRQTFVAEPLHALFLNEHEPYAVSHPVSGGDECTVLEFSSAHAQQVALSFDARHIGRGPGPFAISRAPLAPYAFYRLHALRRFARDERATPLAIEEEALGLLAGALRDGYSAVGRHSSVKREDTARHRRDLIEHAKVTLAGSPGARWSLDQLAREVHSSPFHLTRVFNEIVGVPVHRYLLQLRLSLALDYIDGGSRQLSAIALQLGFANHSHLSASFRRVFGASPGSFRAGGLRHARNFLTAPRELSSLACGLPERRTEERDARHTSGEVG